MSEINLDELYWANLEEISKDKSYLNKIFDYIKNYDLRNIEELSKILRLYNNPSGLFTEEFANVVVEIYARDKVKFIKALNLVKDESINLVYVFRMKNIPLDEDKDLMAILNLDELSQEELDTANIFLKMYNTICAT